MIHADYVGADGSTAHYDLQNAAAMESAPTASKLRQFGDGLMQRGPEPVESTGSGTTMYVQRGETMTPGEEQAHGQDFNPPTGGGSGGMDYTPPSGSGRIVDYGPRESGSQPPAGGSGEQTYAPPPRGTDRTADYAPSRSSSGPTYEPPVRNVPISGSSDAPTQVSEVTHRVIVNGEGQHSHVPSPELDDTPSWRRNSGRRRNPVRPSSRSVDLSDAFNFGDDDDFI